MDNESAANDRIRASQFKERKHSIKMRFARAIGDDIAHVSAVMFISIRPSVRHSGGVEMVTRRGGIRAETIPFLVNVKTMLAGLQAGKVGDDTNPIIRSTESYLPFVSCP